MAETMTTNGQPFAWMPQSIEELVVQPVTRESVALIAAGSTRLRQDCDGFRVPVVTKDPVAAWVKEGEEIPLSGSKVAEVADRFHKVAGLSVLSDENIAATQVRAGPQLGQNATHRYGRIQPTGRQSDRQHAGRRRLPVRSGHADETHTSSRQRESLRTVNHQLTALTSNRQLRVVLADSSRHDDHRGRIHVRSIVPDERAHADGTQVLKNRRILAV